MRHLAAVLVLLSACADDSTPAPDDCASAWEAWCDAVYDCLDHDEVRLGVDGWVASSRQDCKDQLQSAQAESFDMTLGCAQPDAGGYGRCWLAARELECGDGAPVTASLITSIEACQLP